MADQVSLRSQRDALSADMEELERRRQEELMAQPKNAANYVQRQDWDADKLDLAEQLVRWRDDSLKALDEKPAAGNEKRRQMTRNFVAGMTERLFAAKNLASDEGPEVEPSEEDEDDLRSLLHDEDTGGRDAKAPLSESAPSPSAAFAPLPPPAPPPAPPPTTPTPPSSESEEQKDSSEAKTESSAEKSPTFSPSSSSPPPSSDDQAKWRIDVGGLTITLTTGKEYRLTVENGSLKFFDVVLGASNLIQYAITAFTEKGAEIIKRASDYIAKKLIPTAASAIFASAQATSTAGKLGSEGVPVSLAKAGLSTGGKIVGGVGGGLSIVLGLVSIGMSSNNLVNGTVTVNQLLKFRELIEKAATTKNEGNDEDKEGDKDKGKDKDKEEEKDDPAKRNALRKAEWEISELAKEAVAHSKGTNITKISGGVVSVTGGALTIAGVFFPPLLIPGIITSAVAAVAHFTATVVELCATHKKRLAKIVEDLKEAEIHIFANE